MFTKSFINCISVHFFSTPIPAGDVTVQVGGNDGIVYLVNYLRLLPQVLFGFLEAGYVRSDTRYPMYLSGWIFDREGSVMDPVH